MKKFLTLSILGAALAASSQAALFTYTTLGTFQTGVGNPVDYVETFGGATSLFTTFTFNGGSQTVAPSALPTRGDTNGGVLLDQVDALVGGGPGNQNTVVTLGNVANSIAVGNFSAFGANWDTSTRGEGSNIVVSIRRASDSSIVVIGTLANYTGGFFGFSATGNDVFSQVILTGGNAIDQGTAGSWETFTIDNVQAERFTSGGEGGGGGVPEPSTLGLMGVAMVGLGLLRKARR